MKAGMCVFTVLVTGLFFLIPTEIRAATPGTPPPAQQSPAETSPAKEIQTQVLPPQSAAQRADALLSQMTEGEKLTLVAGYFGVWSPRVPKEYRSRMPDSAGFVPGIPRLNIPDLTETDASLGVANGGFMRPNDEAVALPSSVMTAATWNPQMAYDGGAMIGAEARNKGFNVLLAGGINLTREPRAGRTFEYAGEDPALAGIMVGESIRGIQALNIISTIKHFALNDHETGRMILNADIDEAALRESDLLAFELAMSRGAPGSVMCAYNRIDGAYACENDFLLNQVLKQDWGFGGFVMSDWGAVHSTVDAANHGLDQESSQFSDAHPFFAAPLKAALDAGTVSQARLDDMAGRIIRTMISKGVMDHPVKKQPLHLKADLAVAQRDAEEGIVLLRNQNQTLPIRREALQNKRILVLGGYADVGVMSGGGSSQVIPIDYFKQIAPWKTGHMKHPTGASQITARNPVIFNPPSPLSAIRELAEKRAPGTRVVFYNGTSIATATRLAKRADMIIVFATQWMQEGRDNRDLTLAGQQDALIEKMAALNPRTVVVLETGGPVLMPWLDKVGAVLEAWYPGNRGGPAIANVLFGKVNPSGHLPLTFPASVKQLPHRYIAGFGTRAPRAVTNDAITAFDTFYQEGAYVGYKWFALNNEVPLFPFGFGLSYSHFALEKLAAAGGPSITVNFNIRNYGKVAGKGVGQIYVMPPGGAVRLVGWQKVWLKPGETKRVAVRADRRLLARFDTEKHMWHIEGGDYQVFLARSATDTAEQRTVHMEDLYFSP